MSASDLELSVHAHASNNDKDYIQITNNTDADISLDGLMIIVLSSAGVTKAKPIHYTFPPRTNVESGSLVKVWGSRTGVKHSIGSAHKVLFTPEQHPNQVVLVEKIAEVYTSAVDDTP